MTKQPVTERIYAALQAAALGKPQVAINRAIDFAAIEVGMMPGLVRRYLKPMETVEWIDNDGYTLWLVRDHGPRPKSTIRKDTDEKRRKELAEGNKKTSPETRKLLAKIARADRRKKKQKKKK